jgi:hypothetical protein
MKLTLLLLLAIVPVFPAPKGAAKLSPEAEFAKTVQPLLASNCVGCHNPKAKMANLDLQQFKTVDSVRANLKLWRKIAWKMEQGDMPPPKTPQPHPTAKKAFLKWVNAELANAPVAQR